MMRLKLATLALAVALPVAAAAAALVNINTADLATLETLNGIGASKGQAIIDYRTQHGPFATIADIQNVSGIGPTTYANIRDFITVSDTAQTQTQTDAGTSQSTTTQADTTQTVQSTQSAGGLGPPPITAQITTGTAAIVGAGTAFEGGAFGAKGEPLASGVRYLWNFGDGSVLEGKDAVHTFAYPGTYDIELSVGYNYSSATARVALAAAPAQVGLIAEGDGSLTVANYSSLDLDIGRWSLMQGTSTFAIPEGTVVLAGKGVRFAPLVLGFAGGASAALYYPNGSRAAKTAVGANSPLRGEVVSIASTKSASSGYADLTAVKSAEVASPSLGKPPSAAISSSQAAAAAAGAKEVEWSYLLGLAAVLALGAVGAYYAHMPQGATETSNEADEFDIE